MTLVKGAVPERLRKVKCTVTGIAESPSATRKKRPYCITETKHVNPNKMQITKLADRASIPKAEAEKLFEQVRKAVDRWPEFAEQAGLLEKGLREVDMLLNKRGSTAAVTVP